MAPLTARLVKADNRDLICEWKPPGDRRISVVTCNTTQLVCASACDIYYIEIKDGALHQVKYVLFQLPL